MLISAISDDTVTVYIRKRSESGGYGDWWDSVDTAFEADMPAGVELVEDDDIERLHALVFPQLSNYTGSVEVFFYVGGSLRSTTAIGLVDGVPLAEVAAPVIPTPSTELSLVTVGRARTWRLTTGGDGNTARNVVSIAAGSNEWLAFDFSEMLDGNDSIESVVVVDLESELTATETKVSANRTEAHVQLSGYNANQSNTLRATAVTAQGETLVGQGVLRVE